MRKSLLKIYVNVQIMLGAIKSENGQDLIEYAFVAALIGLAATTGMHSVASGVNAAFTNVASKLNSYV